MAGGAPAGYDEEVAPPAHLGGYDEEVPPPVDSPHADNPGFLKSFVSDLAGYLTPSGVSPYPGMDVEAKQAMAQQSAVQDKSRQEAGYSKPYRALAPLAEGIGVNVPGMETSAKQGDVGGVLGHAAAPLAVVAASRTGDVVPSFERAKAALTTEVYPRVGQNVVDVSAPAKTFTNLLNRPAGKLLPPQVRSALGEFVDRMNYDRDPYRFRDLHELTSDLNDYIFSKEGRDLAPKTRALLQQGVVETRSALDSAAQSAGVGKQWRGFNREYARASKIQSAANIAGGTLGGAAGGFLGYEGGKQLGIPGYLSGPAGAAGGAALGKSVVGGMVRSVLNRPLDVAPPPGAIENIMQAAKDGTISPGEATRRISNMGGSTKVQPPKWSNPVVPSTPNPPPSSYLYHGTDMANAAKIESSGRIGGGDNSIWLTENPEVAKYHAQFSGGSGKVFRVNKANIDPDILEGARTERQGEYNIGKHMQYSVPVEKGPISVAPNEYWKGKTYPDIR